jgi:hypothetical protein
MSILLAEFGTGSKRQSPEKEKSPDGPEPQGLQGARQTNHSNTPESNPLWSGFFIPTSKFTAKVTVSSGNFFG